jgi:acyl-CoA synthetase (NDP forming)
VTSDSVFCNLDRLFNPQAIAVIGASGNPKKIGARPIVNLERGGFAGAVVPVNPRYEDLFGLQCFGSVLDSGQAVDLALIAAPDARVSDAIDDCIRAEVPYAAVFTSGYAETGDLGRGRQSELVRRANEGGVRILGPNTLGLTSSPSGMIASFSTVFDRVTRLRPGKIGFVSQSGALGAIMCGQMDDQGFGFSRFVSIGNESDIDVADCLAYLADDPETTVIGGYLENVKDGKRFIRAARRVAEAGKSISFLKVGRSAAGARATQSHTGALAGSDDIYEAALKQAGVVRAQDMQGLTDFLQHHADRRSLDSSKGVGVLTVSGGAGVWIADKLEDHSVPLTELAPSTVGRLQAVLPSFASSVNPVDATGHIVNDPSLLEPALEALFEDPGVSSLVLMMGLQESNGHTLAATIADTAEKYPHVQLFVVWLAGPRSAYELLRSRGVAVFDDLARCVATLAASFTANALVAGRVAGRVAGQARGSLPGEMKRPEPFTGLASELEAKQILGSLGIPTPDGLLCSSLEEVRGACEHLGYPLVLKGQVPGVAHKTEHNLVEVGVADSVQAASAFARLATSMASLPVGEAGTPVLVETMAGDGLDLMVGVVTDATFGPVIMVGPGGVNVELYDDRVVRVAPVSVLEADEMISQLRASKLLDGYRGSGRLDRESLARVVSTVSHFAFREQQWLREVEINPLRVLGEGRSSIALDALMVGEVAVETS